MENNSLKYTKPEFEIFNFDYTDIICSSVGGCPPVYPCPKGDTPPETFLDVASRA